jgi:hypothetical protein
MKRSLFLALTMLTSWSFTQAQTTKQLKKVLELHIPRQGGQNAASVAWHPIQKKYYASMAGNTKFCIGIYDINGHLLSDSDQQALFDVRGLWYNPTTKTLQMNGYKEFGWGEYHLDSKGLPESVSVLHDGMNQTDEQSPAAFNPGQNVSYFFNPQGNVDIYNFSDATFKETVTLHLGISSDGPPADNTSVIDQYNSSTIIYTGIKGSELGLLNYDHLEIELYDISTGLMTKKLSLPSDTQIPEARWLNFAFCNGIYWLFNTEERTWVGFR